MTSRPLQPSPELQRGVAALLAVEEEGAFMGEMRWNTMLPAQYVIAHRVLGIELSEARKAAILRGFASERSLRGLWGLHRHADPSLFVTTLVYVAARLCGASADDPMLAPARRWFRELGGVERIPTWGRAWLAPLGLYGWEGIVAMPPEAWLLPDRSPVHPGKLYCHTRLIYAGLSALTTLRPEVEPDADVIALREELYPRTPYASIDFAGYLGDVHPGDLAAPSHPLLRALFGFARVFDRRCPRELRARAMDKVIAILRGDLSTTTYMGLSPVSGLLAMLVLWAVDPDDPHLARALERLDAWVFEDEDGLRVAGALSTTWDTAFALNALHAAGLVGRAQQVIRESSRFLASQQIQGPLAGYRSLYRINPSGGFCFARVEHGWPVSDCTAEALSALLQAPEGTVDSHTLHAAVGFILRCQSPDGSFGSYEPRRGDLRLDALNPSEMFRECMTEGGYVECTGSCLVSLDEWRHAFPNHPLVPDVTRSIARGERFLRARQLPDGSWDAAWGVHRIYGTLFAIRGLRAAGAGPGDRAIARAVRFLVERQRGDGGFGEHEQGAMDGTFAPLHRSHPVQTAWALLALAASERADAREAAARAAAYLGRTQRSDGTWSSPRWVGVFFRTALVDYDLYRVYFPVWALGAYERMRLQPASPRASSAMALA